MLTTAASVPSSVSNDPLRGTGLYRYKQIIEQMDGIGQTAPAASMNDPIVINVSGKRFETYEETLARFPDTLLGSPNRRAKFFNPKKGEYFFDRHRSAFDAVLYYYQAGGTLIRPEHVPPHVFVNEAIFYDLPEEALNQVQQEAGIVDEPEEKVLPKNYYINVMWQTLEYPEYSLLAKCLAIFSVVIIVFSLIIFCVETLPQFAPPPKPSNASADWEANDPYAKTWFQLNTFVIAWFTGEYILRFLCAPEKIKFLISSLNIIDLLSILPYYVQLAIDDGGSSSISVLRVVRVVRVFRVFKLSRHSRGLQILGNTLRASLNELLMLMFFLGIGVTIFASCVYYAEGGIDSDFASIPHSFWWAVVTMTTVGYGDISPTTFWGKIVGALCAISGLLENIPIAFEKQPQYATEVHKNLMNSNSSPGASRDATKI
ncbi:Potassium voltage-gated channel subfamily A member 2 [Exaiptasia diaphana]|nr:Potassium voltage-gated channel subfamily A member 2 [Exaiptasia diaphana]